MPRPSCFNPGNDKRLGGLQDRLWMRAEKNFDPIQIQFLDCPTHYELLYWLHYASHLRTHLDKTVSRRFENGVLLIKAHEDIQNYTEITLHST